MASYFADGFWPRTAVLASSTLASYTLLCSILRFRRRNLMQQKFNYPTRASLATMTNDDAQIILSIVAELEFPEMYYRSLQYALFKTYAIPTISQLLAATKQLVAPEFSPKRYVDTGLLIGEFSTFPPTSDRTIRAIARMNYLHGHYMKQGKISQDDLLYTLSVFITEPITWINKCEWRQLTDMEKCAVSTFWKSIGDAMGIEYGKLRRFNEWKDGIEFYEDIRDWAIKYEHNVRVPATSNFAVAEGTTAIMLCTVPKSMKSAALGVVCAVMENEVREAMMYPKPKQIYFTIAKSVISFRRFLLRYFFLPRPAFMRVREVSDNPDPRTGRYNPLKWTYHPYYVKPGFWNQWGAGALLFRAMGLDVPGMKNDYYMADGYEIASFGPKIFANKGVDEMKRSEEQLREQRTGGCPFALRG